MLSLLGYTAGDCVEFARRLGLADANSAGSIEHVPVLTSCVIRLMSRDLVEPLRFEDSNPSMLLRLQQQAIKSLQRQCKSSCRFNNAFREV